jgi:UDP-glucose 4-epimerase
MKILITGGAGFIGSNLALQHLKQKDAVWVVDNLSTGRMENLYTVLDHPYFRFTKADVNTWHDLSKAVTWADKIYHMAAIVGQQVVIKRPVSVISENIQGCERLLKMVRQHHQTCRVLIASTSEVYGSDGKSSFKEDAPLTFASGKCVQVNYSLSKYVGETMALSFVHEYGLNCVIVRLFNTIGPHQTGRYGMVVPRFIEQASEHKPITVYGTGMQSRSFCDIRDTCKQLQLLLQDSAETQGEIFNVGNDREITILELAQLIKRRASSPSEIVFMPYEQAYGIPFHDTVRRRPDLSKIKTRYGFIPEWSLEASIDDLLHKEAMIGVK